MDRKTVGSVPATGGKKWSAATAERVLEVVRETGSCGLAARAAGVSPSTVQHWRRRDQEFRALYDEAMAEAFEGLLDVAMEMARGEGTRQALSKAGEVVEVRREPNEKLLLALLQFRFKDDLAQRLDVNLNRGVVAVMTPDQLLKLEPEDRRTLLTILEKYDEPGTAP